MCDCTLAHSIVLFYCSCMHACCLLLAKRINLIVTVIVGIPQEPPFHGNTEMVWVKLYLNKSKPIYACSLYRPPGSSPEPLFELSDILTKTHESSVSPVILLAGDFNLPDIKFEDM